MGNIVAPRDYSKGGGRKMKVCEGGVSFSHGRYPHHAANEWPTAKKTTVAVRSSLQGDEFALVSSEGLGGLGFTGV